MQNQSFRIAPTTSSAWSLSINKKLPIPWVLTGQFQSIMMWIDRSKAEAWSQNQSKVTPLITWYRDLYNTHIILWHYMAGQWWQHQRKFSPIPHLGSAIGYTFGSTVTCTHFFNRPPTLVSRHPTHHYNVLQVTCLSAFEIRPSIKSQPSILFIFFKPSL